MNTKRKGRRMLVAWRVLVQCAQGQRQ